MIDLLRTTPEALPKERRPLKSRIFLSCGQREKEIQTAKRVGKILQERAFAHRDRTRLLSGRDTWTTAIEPGSAGGGQLRERTRLYLNLQAELVSSQYTSRNIMHMYQSSTG